MTSTIESLMIHDLTVERREVREDRSGGQVVRWRQIAHIRGRISMPPSSRPTEIAKALSLQEKIPYYLYVLPEADVERGDVVSDATRRLFIESIVEPSVPEYRRAEASEFQEEIHTHAPPEEVP